MQHAFLWYRRATISLILAATLACDGGDDGPSGPTPSIQLTASPASLTLQQGASGTVTLTLARTNISSPVSVAVSGLPTGVSASVTPASLTGATTTATVTVDVASSVAPGNYTATVAASATGVGSAGATFGLTVTAAPNVVLTLTPPTLTIQAGRSGNTSVTVTRTNFTGTLTLSLDTPPAGITGSFNPVTVAADNSALTVNVGLGVAPANYTLTIRATATGLGERTVTLPLTVTAPPPGSIALTVAPQSTSVVQGGVGQLALTITRTDFSGAVTLAASGAPAGVTVTFSETPTSASQVQLLYSTTLAAPVGTYTVTVTASATGVSNATAIFTLQVTQAPPSNQVEVQFCSSSENPVFLAYQDGTGSWQPVTGTLSGGVYRYAFSLTQNRGGVFFVQLSGSSTPRWAPGGRARQPILSRVLPAGLSRLGHAPIAAAAVDRYETIVFYGTVAALASEGIADCSQSTVTKSVSVQVTGLHDGEAATLSLGGSTAFVPNPSGSPAVKTVQLTDVRSGVIDLLAARADVLAVQTNKLVDVRDLNPADGSTLPFTVDFEGANAYAPASAQVAIANTGGDLLLFFGSLLTANGDAALVDVEHGVPPAPDVTRVWEGIPTARLKAGDMQATFVIASPASTSTNEVRTHMTFSTSVQAMTQTLGARLPTPTALSIGLPAYRRLRVQGALPSEYSNLVGASFGPSGGGGNEILVIQTGAYLAATGSTAAYDLSIPDLTALAGFPFAAGLPAGPIEVLLEVSGWTGAGVQEPIVLNGTILRSASKSVTVMVP